MKPNLSKHTLYLDNCWTELKMQLGLILAVYTANGVFIEYYSIESN